MNGKIKTHKKISPDVRERSLDKINIKVIKDPKKYSRNICCMFDVDDPKEAFVKRNLTLIKEYGSHNKQGKPTYCSDSGERNLYKCNKCGAYVLEQESNSIFSNEITYLDYFPVTSENFADQLNENYSGDELENNHIYKWLSVRENNCNCNWIYPNVKNDK